jgi:DNA-binding beta-propeller fold protein YncE
MDVALLEESVRSRWSLWRPGRRFGAAACGAAARPALAVLCAAALVVPALGCGGAAPTVGVAPGAKAAAEAGPACARQRPGVGPVRADATRQGASVQLARSKGRTLAYVADEDSRAVHVVDVDRGSELSTVAVGGAPAQLLVLADGRVAVTLRDKNRVAVLEPLDDSGALEARCSVPVATEPFGLAATPDDARLLVTSGVGRTVTALETGTLRQAFAVAVAREPRAIVVDDDGRRAFVAHVVGGKMSVIDLDQRREQAGDAPSTGDRAVRELDLRVKKVVQAPSRNRAADRDRGGCQGFALAKSVSGKEALEPGVGEKPPVTQQVPKKTAPTSVAPARPGRIFAPMVTVDPGDPEVRSTQYYGEVLDGVPKEAPLVSVIDAKGERPLTRAVLSLGQGTRTERECLLPRSATVRQQTGTLLVSCLGIDSVVELDTRGVDPARLERRRWQVPAGPTGVAIDEVSHRAFVWSQFDGKLTALDLAGDAEPRSIAVSYRPAAAVAAVAQGRKLFHAVDDARISSDGTACASCHPDGREDALTWSTPDGPRQTIMLAGRTATSAPYGWTGTHATLHAYVTNTFTRLGGTGLQGPELDALVAYLEGMPGPANDGARSGEQQQLARRGQQLFFESRQGCASCHVGGVGADAGKHDVASGTKADMNGTFETPSLRFIGATAPYFHDGRYPTLDALLSSADSRMGHTAHLDAGDRRALRAYLETL